MTKPSEMKFNIGSVIQFKPGSSSQVVSREACPKCRDAGGDYKGDNLVVYSNGGKHCFQVYNGV